MSDARETRSGSADTQRRHAHPVADANEGGSPLLRWSFGLERYAWVGNASAMGVMVVALLYLGYAYIRQAENERAYHRSEATTAHAAVAEIASTMRQLTAEVRALSDQVRADRQATAELAITVRALANEVKKIKERDGPAPPD